MHGVNQDFMPLEGWDHIELWVGNAKQCAYYYEHAFGFQPVAYSGPETGVRDRASYVLEQGAIRLVVTSALRPDHEIARHAHAHGDGVKDAAFQVKDAGEAYRRAVEGGATGVAEPNWVEDEHGRVELASIATYGETLHTFVNREEYEGAYLPGYQPLDGGNGKPQLGVGLELVDHVVGNVELGRMEHWVEFYERSLGFAQLVHFTDEAISTEYSALMSKVMTGGGGASSFRSTSRPKGSARARSRSTWSSTAARECSTSPWPRATSSRPWTLCANAASASSRLRRPTTTTSSSVSARSVRTGPT